MPTLFNSHIIDREMASIRDEALNYPPNIQPRFIAAQRHHLLKTEAHTLARISATAQTVWAAA